jgi:hypothetical protein
LGLGKVVDGAHLAVEGQQHDAGQQLEHSRDAPDHGRSRLDAEVPDRSEERVAVLHGLGVVALHPPVVGDLGGDEGREREIEREEQQILDRPSERLRTGVRDTRRRCDEQCNQEGQRNEAARRADHGESPSIM